MNGATARSMAAGRTLRTVPGRVVSAFAHGAPRGLTAGEREPSPAGRFGRTRSVVRASTVAVTTAGLAFGAGALLIALAFGSSTPGAGSADRNVAPDTTLTADADFLITSTVSSSAACDNVALFLPGAQDYICYTVHNPYTQPFTVESISISKTTAPTDCPVSNLDLSDTTYSGTPALTVAAHGTGVVAEPISMVASTTNQDACLGTTFQFSNVGTARVTTPTTPSTSTTTTTAPVTTTTGPATPTTTTTAPVTTTTEAPSSPLASTGADIAGASGAGMLAIGVGALLVLAGKRRRRKVVGGTGRGIGTVSSLPRPVPVHGGDRPISPSESAGSPLFARGARAVRPSAQPPVPDRGHWVPVTVSGPPRHREAGS